MVDHQPIQTRRPDHFARWERVREKLRASYGEAIFKSWLQPLKLADVATITLDNVAEWLRRQIANLLLLERAGSSPAVVDILYPICHSLWPFGAGAPARNGLNIEIPQSRI